MHESGVLTNDPEHAAACIRRGGVVGLPTETVYGLAADATDPAAVQRVFDIKGRPRDHPLIVHLADPDELDRVSDDPSPTARVLARLGWPGPLTVIVPRGPAISPVATGGRATVGVRVPAHDVARAVIAASAVPLAAPSANRFGSVSPTTAAHVLADLSGLLDPRRDCVIDGGDCEVGVESTIVDCTTDPPQILRTGAITAEMIASLTGAHVGPTRGPARASGMLASHYAPDCEVRLVDTRDDADALCAGLRGCRIIDHRDPVTYAKVLYAELRQADLDGVATVVAVLPPAEGIGFAVRDRLVKAAAPRPARGRPSPAG
jgi:L-threonylcarbamoyladenylate synthase